MVAQLQLGAPPRKRKAAYVRVDDALDRLHHQYFGGRIPNLAGLLQYMDTVAHQMYDVKHWTVFSYVCKNVSEWQIMLLIWTALSV
jgi:hypothetical protein